jgi:transposase
MGMAAAIKLRHDYGADDLRRLARSSRDAKQTRRLLALASIYNGSSRSEAAKIGGVTLQIVRDWGVRFNAEGPDGLLDRKAPGRAPLLNAEQRTALAAAVDAGPKPYLDGVVRWRLVDLVQWIWNEFGISISRQALGNELRAMGSAKLSARPRHHAQDPEAIEEFKNVWPAPSARCFSMLPFQSAPTYPASEHRSPPRWSFARPGPHKPRGVVAPYFKPGFRSAV